MKPSPWVFLARLLSFVLIVATQLLGQDLQSNQTSLVISENATGSSERLVNGSTLISPSGDLTGQGHGIDWIRCYTRPSQLRPPYPPRMSDCMGLLTKLPQDRDGLEVFERRRAPEQLNALPWSAQYRTCNLTLDLQPSTQFDVASWLYLNIDVTRLVSGCGEWYEHWGMLTGGAIRTGVGSAIILRIGPSRFSEEKEEASRTNSTQNGDHAMTW